MARYPEQCSEPVTHIVRHPQWDGDFYAVCELHVAWAKERVARSGPVKVVATGKDITSGCVFVVDAKVLQRRQHLDRRALAAGERL